jgi:HK97 family phage major capsid protein
MDELLDRLIEARGVANDGFRKFVDPINKEGRSFTAEEHQEYQRRNAELDGFDERIGDAKKRIEGDRQVDEYKATAERSLQRIEIADQSAEGKLERDFLAFVRNEPGTPSHFDLSLRGLKVERDESTGRNVVREQRSETVGTYATAGATVPISFRAVLYQHMIQMSAVRQTRATVLTTSSGEPLIMPKTTAHPAAGTITAEGGVIGESDPSFGAGTLHAYKYGNLVPVSHELISDTGVDLLGYLGMAMGRALGIGSGGDFIKGVGTSGPKGVLVSMGTVSQTLGGTGVAGVPTYKNLEAVYDSILPAYQAQGEWVMSQKTVSSLRQITDTLGRPLWVPSLSGNMPDTIFGKNFYIDSASGMPDVATNATAIAFGDWATFFIRDVEGLRFERSIEYGFNTDMVYFRAIIRTDGLLLDTTGSIGSYVGGTA